MRAGLSWVLFLGGMGCVVEPVTVHTGGSVDTGAQQAEGPERPGQEAADEGTAPEPTLPTPHVEPAEVDAGEHLLAFVVTDGAADATAAVALSLYGEPDVVVATWAVRDAGEIAVSLEVAASSPPGPLDVVVDLADGGVLRIPAGLTVR